MSAGAGKLPWAAVAPIAQQLVEELLPVVDRARTVGSVRRKRPEVGDIELLVEPRTISIDLLDTKGPDVDSVRAVALRWGRLIKNGEKFLQVELSIGIRADLFLCTPPAQWGSLLAIRTGPAELSTHAVTCMKSYGLRHINGHVEDSDGKLVPTPTEEEFFAAARLPCLLPSRRDDPAAFRSIAER